MKNPVRRLHRLQRADAAWRPHREDAASRDSEAFNRSVVESSPDCIKVLDLDGRLLSILNGQDLLGIEDIGPYLGQPWTGFWQGADRVAACAAIEVAKAGGKGRFVGFCRTFRGEPKWWDVSVAPIRNANDPPTRLLAVSRDVTERQQSEQLMVQQAAELTSLYATAPVGLFVFDTNLRFVRINRMMAELNGLSAEQHIGCTPREILPPGLADAVEPRLRQVLETGRPMLNSEVHGATVAKSDDQRYWLISCYPVQAEGGPIKGVQCTMQEITERKQAEQALHQSEERFRAFVTTTADVVYCMSPDWSVMRQLHGQNFIVDPKTPSENWLLQHLLPEDRPRVMAIIDEAIRNKRMFEMEHRVRRADGSPGWTFSHAVPLLDAGGEIVEWIGTASDVSERKRAEQALRESEERYRSLFNSMDEGYCVIEMILDVHEKPVDYRFVEVNPAFEMHTGLSDAVGKRFLEFALDALTSWVERYGQVALTGEPIRFADECPASRRWFDVYAFRIGAPGDWKVAIIVNNITERTQAEQALRASAQTLVDLDRRKDEFLAMLCHELRNPLAPIANAVHLLRRQNSNDPVQHHAITIIDRQVRQLTHLVDELLDMSRINTGRVQLRRQTVAMSHLIERAVETVHPLIVQRRHALTVSVSAQPLWLNADPFRLEQVIVNLLTNAAKYTDVGGRIGLSVEPDGHDAVLRVRDTGMGIASELLPYILDLFTQAQRSLDRSQGGLGIGLSLVQRLVALHGGTVEAHSVPGQGSELVVRLPTLRNFTPPAPLLVGETAPLIVPLCRVLVVDDNVDLARSLALLLEMSGHAVRMVHDGPSALEAALIERPDVVLLDIGLPHMDGFEVARRMRQQPALEGVVLVAMTGYGQATDRQRSQEAGIDHHLVKPVDFDEVEKILVGVSQNTG